MQKVEYGQRDGEEAGRGKKTRTPVVMEGRGCVKNHLDPGALDHFVEGVGLRDIGHDDDVELVLCELGVGIADPLCLVFGPDRGHHLVALLEELLQDVGCGCPC